MHDVWLEGADLCHVVGCNFAWPRLATMQHHFISHSSELCVSGDRYTVSTCRHAAHSSPRRRRTKDWATIWIKFSVSVAALVNFFLLLCMHAVFWELMSTLCRIRKLEFSYTYRKSVCYNCLLVWQPGSWTRGYLMYFLLFWTIEDLKCLHLGCKHALVCNNGKD